MLRKIYAEIEFDQEVADRYAETNGLDEPTPIDHLEKEFGWIEQSGITLKRAFIADHDEDDEWFAYLNYLTDWAFDHSSYEYEGKSPASFEKWKAGER